MLDHLKQSCYPVLISSDEMRFEFTKQGKVHVFEEIQIRKVFGLFLKVLYKWKTKYSHGLKLDCWWKRKKNTLYKCIHYIIGNRSTQITIHFISFWCISHLEILFTRPKQHICGYYLIIVTIFLCNTILFIFSIELLWIWLSWEISP